VIHEARSLFHVDEKIEIAIGPFLPREQQTQRAARSSPRACGRGVESRPGDRGWPDA
jgi:hypothetical protein